MKSERSPRPTQSQPTGHPEIDAEIQRCITECDYDRFNSVILGRAAYWSRQVEICESVRKYRTTAVPSGNAVGKSYIAGGIIPAFAACHPGSKTVVAAPTQAQLTGVVWSEVQASYLSAHKNGLPLGGRLKALSWDFDSEGWRIEGFGSGSVESKSGRHAGDLLAVVDEASGVPAQVLEAIDSLNPSRILYLGNPLRPEGKFFDVCQQRDNPHVNVIRVPSLESPDIGLERSPRGMADRTWLESCRMEYGEESTWWLCHVLAMFPGDTADVLLPSAWLDLAAQTVHLKTGDRWIGVDIGEGGGGDDSVIVGRDDNGILGWEASNRWSLETLASRVRHWSDEWRVEPSRIVYDQAGIGADFDSRLRTEGINGAKPYKGASGGGNKFMRLRAASAWRFRQRLDPKRTHRQTDGKRSLWVPQTPFAIPPALLRQYRAEFTGLRYVLTLGDKIDLEPKDEFVKRLKRSPNVIDAIIMTFAYPYA